MSNQRKLTGEERKQAIQSLKADFADFESRASDLQRDVEAFVLRAEAHCSRVDSFLAGYEAGLFVAGADVSLSLVH
ncbi:MAG: hypothetical protein OXQ94_12975 [Gemmatimonadota bacterium]|nr:hypothetical protein [Gemmatimonadota bacterium]